MGEAEEIPSAPDGWPAAERPAIDRAHADGGIRAAIARAMWRRDYQPGPEAQTSGFVYEIADRIAKRFLPAYEARLREQIAAEIEANPMNECSGAVAECARIARGGNRG